MNRLARIIRLASLHETRRALVGWLRAGNARRLGRRLRSDRDALFDELRDPAAARAFAAAAVRHPATRELAEVGLTLLPGRWLPIGWAASWVARRIGRRSWLK